MEQVEIASKTDDLKLITSEPAPTLTKDPPAEELPTAILDMIHGAFSRILEVLGAVSANESSRNKKLEQAEVDQHRLLEETSAYRMKKEKSENMMLEKKVVIRALTPSLAHSKSIVTRQETARSLTMEQ